MSSRENDIYLEAMREEYEIAIDAEDLAAAQHILKELRNNGYANEADLLEEDDDYI